jgi:two-component system chemotaxis response regulator CheY
MIDIDDEVAERYLGGCREHLATMDTDLLALENGESQLDEERFSRVLRAVHSIRVGAGFFDQMKMHELARHMEEALAKVRSGGTVLTRYRVGVLRCAADRLKQLIPAPDAGSQSDIAETLAALAALPSDHGDSVTDQSRDARGTMRSLLVEDDFSSRLLLQTFLSRYGECHVAVNGAEAVEAFRFAMEQKQKYDLICMDIMMPEMDGREAVRRIRAMEEAKGILSTYGTKIIMTTAVDDVKSVAQCFQDLCDAYLVKPIDLAKLLSQMKSYELVK